MQAHRVQATIQPGGTLTVRGLPLREGENVEVIILVKEEAAKPAAYPLRGARYSFEDPFTPVTPPEEDSDGGAPPVPRA